MNNQLSFPVTITTFFPSVGTMLPRKILEQLPRVLISIHLDYVRCILYFMLNRVFTTCLSSLEGRCSQNAKQAEEQNLHFNALLYSFSKNTLGISKPQTLTGIDISAFIRYCRAEVFIASLSGDKLSHHRSGHVETVKLHHPQGLLRSPICIFLLSTTLQNSHKI